MCRHLNTSASPQLSARGKSPRSASPGAGKKDAVPASPTAQRPPKPIAGKGVTHVVSAEIAKGDGPAAPATFRPPPATVDEAPEVAASPSKPEGAATPRRCKDDRRGDPLGAELQTLPHRPKSIETTRAHIAANAERLTLVFLHYARMSGVSSLREATRLRFVGLQQLARDAMLDSRDFDLNAITRACSQRTRRRRQEGRAGATHRHRRAPEMAELRLEQFFQLVVQLAFCWSHPRHGHAPLRRAATKPDVCQPDDGAGQD